MPEFYVCKLSFGINYKSWPCNATDQLYHLNRDKSWSGNSSQN